MATRKAPIEINMEDCKMEFVSSSGVKVFVLDTFCKDFTPEKKQAAGTEIVRIYNNIMARCAAAEQGRAD